MATAETGRMDIVDLIIALKLNNEAEVLMIDFEKTSPFYSSVGGIIMDVGYNFVGLGASIDGSNMSKPAKEFINDSTAKVVYEVLKNPVFYNELSKLQRVKKESNAFLYDYYRLLEDQEWFSKDISQEQLAHEFSQFMYVRAGEIRVRYDKHIKRHKSSMSFWENTSTYKEDPTGSGAARRRESAEVRYDKAKGVSDRLDRAFQQELNVEKELNTGYEYLNQKLGKIQSTYQEVLYKMQSEGLKKTGGFVPMDYKQTWEKDKAIFQSIGYGDIIEPWEKIMGDLTNKMKSNSNLLAVSAYNIGSEESDFEITARALGVPKYANFIDDYRSFCLQNLVAKLKKVDGEDIVNLMFSTDQKKVEGSIKNVIATKGAETVSLEAHIRDLHQAPKYSQTHTGVMDAFDQSGALVETIRREVIKALDVFEKRK